MLSYLHHPDEAVVRANLESAQENRVLRHAMPPDTLDSRQGKFWKHHAAIALECASAAYALEGDAALVRDLLRDSSACFTRALAKEGAVNLAEMQQQLALAVLLGDSARLEALCALPRARYSSPDMVFPEAAHGAFEVFCALATQQPDAARSRLAEADALLAGGKLPRPVRDDIGAALALEQAILDGNASGFDDALGKRNDSFAAKFSNPQIQHHPHGLLDVWGLGLASLARARGLKVQADSVYTPQALLHLGDI